MTSWNEVVLITIFRVTRSQSYTYKLRKSQRLYHSFGLAPRCCHYLYQSCYWLILLMQSNLINFFCSSRRIVCFDGQLFLRPVWFGLISPIRWILIISYFLYIYLKRHSIVFRKPVLFVVLVSEWARYLDRHLLIRSQFVHHKKIAIIETYHENVVDLHVKCSESKYEETYIYQ